MIINNNINSLLGQPSGSSAQSKKENDSEVPTNAVVAETKYTGSSEKDLRMAELKMQISEGSYTIDFNKLAEKVISKDFNF